MEEKYPMVSGSGRVHVQWVTTIIRRRDTSLNVEKVSLLCPYNTKRRKKKVHMLYDDEGMHTVITHNYHFIW